VVDLISVGSYGDRYIDLSSPSLLRFSRKRTVGTGCLTNGHDVAPARRRTGETFGNLFPHGGTMTPRSIYLCFAAIYLISFVIPGVRMTKESISGFDSAVILLSTLTYWNGWVNYVLKVFLNLSNIAAVAGICLQFVFGVHRLRWIQLAALVSGTYWIGAAAFGTLTFRTLHVGFWLWYGSLVGMAASTWINPRKSRGG
jgi:hypothetical protein